MAEPVVGLSEVVEDDAAAVAAAGRQDDRGGGVGFAGHPGRVEGVCNEEEGHDQNHPTGNLEEMCNRIIRIPGFTHQREKKRGVQLYSNIRKSNPVLKENMCHRLKLLFYRRKSFCDDGDKL